MEKIIMADLSALKEAVAKNTDVVESAIALLKGLKEKLDACGTDQAALDDLKKTLSEETNRLAAAVAENT